MCSTRILTPPLEPAARRRLKRQLGYFKPLQFTFRPVRPPFPRIRLNELLQQGENHVAQAPIDSCAFSITHTDGEPKFLEAVRIQDVHSRRHKVRQGDMDLSPGVFSRRADGLP